MKQSDLGEYEENVREKQNIQYTCQSTNSPSNQAIWMAKNQFPPANQQIEKNQGVW
jgi:hypothetical protein